MRWLSIVVAGVLLASCAFLDPHTQSTALRAIDNMLAQGAITPEQHEALRQAILDGGSLSWWQMLGNVALAIGGAYLGIQVAPARLLTKRGAAAVVAQQVAQAARSEERKASS